MLQRLIEMFISKKKVIGFVSAIVIALIAAVLGMSASEVKESIISGPTIELPQADKPAIVAPSEKK